MSTAPDLSASLVYTYSHKQEAIRDDKQALTVIYGEMMTHHVMLDFLLKLEDCIQVDRHQQPNTVFDKLYIISNGKSANQKHLFVLNF